MSTNVSYDDISRFGSSIKPETLSAAMRLCRGTDNTEYVRGIAEVIIDTTMGINMDDKESLMKMLVWRPV